MAQEEKAEHYKIKYSPQSEREFFDYLGEQNITSEGFSLKRSFVLASLTKKQCDALKGLDFVISVSPEESITLE